MPRNPTNGARVVYAGFQRAASPSPVDRARAIQQITDERDQPRWTWRRLVDRIAYDETLRYLLMGALSVFFVVVLFFGIFG